MTETKVIFLFFILVLSTGTASAGIFVSGEDAEYEASLSAVSIPTNPAPIKTIFISNADTSFNRNLSSVDIPTQPSPIKEIFISNADATFDKNLTTVSIPTEPSPIQEIFISNADATLVKNLVQMIVIIEENIFDTGAPENPYPSISGTFNGTITLYKTIIVKNLYTYPCEGTGGHTEYVRIYNESGTIAEAEWKGYKGDWHNITFPKKFALEGGKTYNITIVTGSYPQIHHTSSLLTPYGWINCTEFIDANGKKYDDWIPAIMLWS